MNVKEIKLSNWQKQYLDRFDDELVVACTAISAGKTRILATWLVLQCLKKPGIRGIIIAQNYRALTKVLVQEILNFATQIGIDIAYNKSSMELEFPNKSILYGYSAENPNAVLGLSEIDILAIDEAAYTNEDIYNYSRDRMRGGKYKPMVRLISSPLVDVRVTNWFSEIVRKYPDKVITATYKDNPFTSDEFKKELEERYVIGSNLFRQQCLGEIFDTDVSSQIVMRSDFASTKQAVDHAYYLGYDAAGLGCDMDTFVVIDRFGVVDYVELPEGDTFQKVNILKNLFNKYNIAGAFADGTGGYSLGVIDLAKASNINIQGINFAAKAYSDEYPNARTEMYLEFAKEIKNGFYVNDQIRNELLAQSVSINGRGLLQLGPKDLVKKAIGHSPDICDACALAVYAMNHSDTKIDEIQHASAVADKYLRAFNLANAN